MAVIATSYPPAYKGGGPARTLEALVAAAPDDVRVVVFAPDRDIGDAQRLPVLSNAWLPTEEPSTIFFFSADQLTKYLKALLSIRHERPDAIYINSFFNPLMAILPLALSRVGFFRGARMLVAPRGEFDRGALSLKRGKKRFYLALFKAMLAHRRIVWHASSSLERAAIVDVFGEHAVVLVRENETSLPPNAVFPVQSDGPLSLVFLSRLSRKKGLDTALCALKSVTSDVVLNVYGPQEDPMYFAECMNIVESLPENVVVRLHGPVEHSNVLETLSSHHAMIFPTRGENFGHVIAEALSVSCPVICSDLTPWSGVLKQGGGLVLDSLEDRAWSAAVQQWADLSASGRFSARLSAGKAFDNWRHAEKGRHIFDLLREAQ